jgi:hypothetical protein
MDALTAVLIVAGTVASYAIAWPFGVPLLVPVLNTAASFPFMVLALARGDLRLAIVRMLIWAMTLGVCATSLSYRYPAATDEMFLHGASYRTEMFAWVLTGRGAESSPSEFIPQQAGHAVLFVCLSIATGGVAAMPMGAMLMNYMGHYVGTLAASSAHPATTIVLAWHPWAVIRVISFVILGVVLSMPVLSRVVGFEVDWRAARSSITIATGGLALDIALKWLLAPTWQRWLLHTVGW